MIRATVIVPAHNAEATLPRTLAALADQEAAPSFEVIVADLGSSDGTTAIAERAGASVVRMGEAGPRDAAWPGAGRNAAVAAASGTLLAFCGADCFPVPGWLAAGTQALREADLVQGRVLPDPGAEPGPFDHAVTVTFESGLYDAGSLFATRALFDRLGGFERGAGLDATGVTAAGPGVLREDAWFGWRARRAGARTAFCAQALCHRAVVPRTPREHIEERIGRRRAAAMVALLPELRETLLHHRLFLDRRTMRLDLALAGVAAAVMRRSTLPLVTAMPYVLELRRHAKERSGDDWKRVAGIDAAADLIGAAALLHGSVEARTPVL